MEVAARRNRLAPGPAELFRGHTRAAPRQRATPEESMEAIWVAAEMRAGGAYAHSALALDEIAAHELGTQP
jgi:alkylhydroperoxidase/carboxymuconolactone decarboxylase family protein YurZ